ncbi:MAG: hypothetical protein ACTIK3_14595 [Sphingobacteriaceae bacterium]
MKKVCYASFVLLGLAFAQPIHAQVSVNVNVGLQPSWGPTGYEYARYYYMPELDIYYDISNRSYTYYDGRRWASHRTLPKRYRKHNLHRTYKVVINDARPWKNHKRYHKKYRGYSKNYKQISRRDGRSNKKFHKAQRKQHRKFEKAREKHYKKMNKGRGKGRR